MPSVKKMSIKERREYYRVKQAGYRSRLKEVGADTFADTCYDVERLAYRGGTTLSDLEEWLGRGLYRWEVDLWFIGGLTGSKQFLKIGGPNKSLGTTSP